MERMKRIIRTSIIGVFINILLGLIKILVGMKSNSISIISDAVNNFSDSIASIITIATTKLASKPATKKHPFGYGRVEFFSGGIIASIVIVTGVEFLTSSVKKIINPSSTSYNNFAFIMLVFAILAKIGLGLYTKKVGKSEEAPSLVASGQDALSDSIITGVTLIGAIITMIFNINLDGWLGVLVSIVVLKSGIEMLWDIISKLLGEREDVELARQIMREIKEHDGIIDAHDLILNNYGPNTYIGMLNVELEDKMTIKEAYSIVKPIQIKIMEKYSTVVYIGFYSVNTCDPKIVSMQNRVKEILTKHEHILQIHAFSVYYESNIMSFDIVVDFDCKDYDGLKKEVFELLKDEFGSYDIKISLEKDFSFSE